MTLGWKRVFVLNITLFAHHLGAASIHPDGLEREFARLTARVSGRVGACVADQAGQACLNAGQRFPMQSVMKLIAGLVIADAVDRRALKLDEPVTVRREDLSLYVQPIANIVNKEGSYRTTIGDLVRRAILDSDSAATDILVRRLGGPRAAQDFLDRKGIRGVRLDRDEKHLQTEIVGIHWRPELVDKELLDRAIRQVPEHERDAAWRRYQMDVRDTATPEGMTAMLRSLAAGRLLSPSSTQYILDTMKQTVTFPDRLKAGLSQGWSVAHKTGTSDTWKGVTAATNDVGILTAPDGRWIAIAVFVADSRAPDRQRAALIASLAKATIAQYR